MRGRGIRREQGWVAGVRRVGRLLEERARTLGLPLAPVRRRVEGAEEALRRLVSVELSRGMVKLTFISSEAARRGAWRRVQVRDLEGRERVVGEGAPPERSYHYAVASETTLKCTCPDAARTAAAASARLGAAGSPPRAVLCKHTVAALGVGLGSGALRLSDSLARTITASLVALAAAEGAELGERAARLASGEYG